MLSFGTFAAKLFGSSNGRKIKKFKSKVDAIAAFEDELKALSDTELRARTAMFREELANGKTLDDILAPAFATVREAARRSLGQRHFDVQMMGGMVLHGGNIAEMKTGEGKTLVATLAAYLNALSGRGVHVVTVNDYLARRDSEWMGRVYKFLGLSVGVIVNDLDDDQRREMYNCDVTYGTNNELGFDYLRDNMKMSASEMVQFGFRPMQRALKTSLSGLDEALNGTERNAKDKDAEEFEPYKGPSPQAAARDLMGRITAAVQGLDGLAQRGTTQEQTDWGMIRTKLVELAPTIETALDQPTRDTLATFTVMADQLREAFKPFALLPLNDDEQPLQHNFAIVDEVDSILIDEARTPLIISGPAEDRSDLYTAVDAVLPKLVPQDYELDEKQKQISFTEAGNTHIEELLREAGLLRGEGLYDIENVTIVHHVNQALKAHKMFQRDRDYIVKGGEVVIIDEFTGRMMSGRRYSEGLHQALEAKEQVEIQPENSTLASITFQNFFRLYSKLSGMTGTASTEAGEFMDIYGLDVIEVPTNIGVARLDEDDEVYRTLTEKDRSIVIEIADAMRRGQPVLVGTTSIEKSETLAARLKDRAFVKSTATFLREAGDGLKAGKQDDLKRQLAETADYLDGLAKSNASDPIPHQVLNARFHEQEALIIAQAGIPSAVTIATNMAGRGTDIQLGGNVDFQLKAWTVAKAEGGSPPTEDEIAAERMRITESVAEGKRKALDAGGLYVIGTERHESRRIDNQLRGRSGRQGDPGRSKFYLSLEDDLMRIFASDRMDSILKKLGIKDGEAITSPIINKALEKAQGRVEARNFDARKYVLKYDDVMNDQRKVVFEQRLDIMAQDDVSDIVADMRTEIVAELVTKHMPETKYAEQWETAELAAEVQNIFDLDLPIAAWAAEEGIADKEVQERIMAAIDQRVEERRSAIGNDNMRQAEKFFLLETLDTLWREHIVTLEQLRQVVGFRSYGGRDPVNEYKTEGFQIFEAMLARLREATVTKLMRVQLATDEDSQGGDRRGGDRRGGDDGGDDDDPVRRVELPALDGQMADQDLGRYDRSELAAANAALAAEGRPTSQSMRSAPLQNRAADVANLDPTDPASWGKVARNSVCPCGSGKKYKHCHGKIG